MKNIKICVVGFFLGSTLLCLMSVIQKIIAGFNPLLIKGYLIPVLFGGTSGSLIAHSFYKIKLLNKKLSSRINKLESFLPICMNCKRIRKPEANPMDMDSWEQVESYISDRTNSKFSHGICPDCLQKIEQK